MGRTFLPGIVVMRPCWLIALALSNAPCLSFHPPLADMARQKNLKLVLSLRRSLDLALSLRRMAQNVPAAAQRTVHSLAQPTAQAQLLARADARTAPSRRQPERHTAAYARIMTHTPPRGKRKLLPLSIRGRLKGPLQAAVAAQRTKRR